MKLFQFLHVRIILDKRYRLALSNTSTCDFVSQKSQIRPKKIRKRKKNCNLDSNSIRKKKKRQRKENRNGYGNGKYYDIKLLRLLLSVSFGQVCWQRVAKLILYFNNLYFIFILRYVPVYCSALILFPRYSTGLTLKDTNRRKKIRVKNNNKKMQIDSEGY